MANRPRDRASRATVGRMGMTELLAAMPEVRAALLADHRRDHTGHCRRCAGANGVAPVWPCRLRLLAESAERLVYDSASSPPARSLRQPG